MNLNDIKDEIIKYGNILDAKSFSNNRPQNFERVWGNLEC